MCEQGELETHQYQRLWLDTAAELGLVAEYLAEVLAWQPSEVQPLPNALELAQSAARRIRQLERQMPAEQPPLRSRRQREYA